ncbi:MAG TPA: hypothetical protein VF941_01580 [Clostridia bacterium]
MNALLGLDKKDEVIGDDSLDKDCENSNEQESDKEEYEEIAV